MASRPPIETLKRYRRDPMAFLSDLTLPGAVGAVRFGDAMADFQRDAFERLAPALLAVADNRKPDIGRFWWERTKGASKDTDLAACLLWLIAFCPRPIDVQVGAADRDQAAELRKAARDWIHANPWLSDPVSVNDWKISNARTGSQADIIAADVTGSHGARPDVLILNEASHVSKQEFAENLLDNAAKVPHGLAIIATNAGILGSWQWTWRENARQSARWHFQKVDRPAPWLDPQEIAEAERRNPPTRYRRLWRGVWSPEGEGDAFDEADINDAIQHVGPMYPTMPRFNAHAKVAGIDLATRRDHCALVIAAAEPAAMTTRVAYVEDWRPKDGKIDLHTVRRDAIEACREYDVCCVVFDASQAALMSEDFQAAGFSVVLSHPTVDINNERATTLMQLLNENRLELYDTPGAASRLISDLRRMCVHENSSGKFRLDATRDRELGHCDRGIALSLCLPDINQYATHRPAPAPPRVVTTDEFLRGFDLAAIQQELYGNDGASRQQISAAVHDGFNQ